MTLGTINLGIYGPGALGDNERRLEGTRFDVDLENLMESNLLLQANSGGGKSWALRRLIEQAFGKLPIIVIDPEGEFSTLRKKYDFFLIGEGGDRPVDVRLAPLLAQRLLKLRASAIIDLFEFPKLRRPAWFAAFVQALVDAPKELWGDVLVVVDEAHDFAPQPGHGPRGGRSEILSESTSAFADLASKGRKRGQVTIAATQRLGKFHKDVAAELKNVLIGQTWIDVDRERAAETLGVAKASKADFFKEVKSLRAGSFFALGRALALEPTLVRTGDVQTEHPTRGRRQVPAPPPTAKIKHLLPQLADLPEVAEAKLRTETELRAEVARLKRELAVAGRQKPVVTEAVRQVRVEVRVPFIPPKVISGLKRLQERVAGDGRAVEELLALASAEVPTAAQGPDRPVQPKAAGDLRGSGDDAAAPSAPEGEWSPSSTQVRMLQQMAVYPEEWISYQQLATLTGVKVSGTFRNNVSGLRVHGCVASKGQRVRLEARGRELAGEVATVQDGAALLELWLARLSNTQGRMLSFIVRERRTTRQAVADHLGVQISGTFRNNLSALRTRGLFVEDGGEIVASELFFR